MEDFEEEMKVADENAKKLVTVLFDMLPTMKLIKNDDTFQQAIQALQASTSESVSGDAGDGNQATTNPLALASS